MNTGFIGRSMNKMIHNYETQIGCNPNITLAIGGFSSPLYIPLANGIVVTESSALPINLDRTIGMLKSPHIDNLQIVSRTCSTKV
jgi:hypothetical protein